MKKQIIILLLFSIHAYSQNARRIKFNSSCTEEFANNYKGKWLITTDKSNYSAEVKKRFQQLQQLLSETYPEPTGGDAAWNGSFVKSSFADQVKYEWNENQMFNADPVKINTVYRYQYNLIVYPWYCCGTNELCNIYPEISGGVGLTIHANYAPIFSGDYLKGNEWTVDGRIIKKRKPVVVKWKGYDIMIPEAGPSITNLATHSQIMITRSGMLPYIPLTRKQFFDRVIPYVKKFYDDLIVESNKMTDKAAEQEYLNAYKRDQKDALKRLQDELEKTAKQGLLDSPAIVSPWDITMTTGEIFSTEENGGYMLVTENPNYFRNDLPNYVPQLFVLEWSWNKQPYGMRFKNAVEENFPIEKLQAMIDK